MFLRIHINDKKQEVTEWQVIVVLLPIYMSI